MLAIMIIGAALVAVTVAIHALGLSLVLSGLAKSHALPPTQALHITFLLIRIALLLLLIHVVEISVWSLFYWREGCILDAEAAFYFSGVTYSTIGYGDMVLAKPWRMLGPIEGLTGILMCSLSAGVFFATVSRVYAPRLTETLTPKQ